MTPGLEAAIESCIQWWGAGLVSAVVLGVLVIVSQRR